MTIGFMLDTVTFNRLLDGQTDLTTLPDGGRLYATHAQRDEISRTKDPFRRKRLLKVFEEVAPTQVPTSSAVWDVSSWDQASWGADNVRFQGMVSVLAQLDKAVGRSNSNPKVAQGQQRDILIAETAIQRGLTLVTDDPRLAEVARTFGGNTCSTEEFLSERNAH